MASKQEPKFPLRLLVDKERNRVVLAEAGADLIDILFSFLTLPLGTAIRLVSKKQLNDQSAEVGCINNLYQSVENFGPEVFWNHICKAMLLSPRNPCEDLCQKLKLKVDDSDPTQYFVCRSCRSKGNLWLSTFSGANCGSCGKLMDKEMKLHEDSDEETNGHGGGVFVKEETTYLIFDDLKVVQSSPGNSVQQLLQLGYKNIHKLVEMSASVGMNEILELLKNSLTSKSPLSDVFLANGESKQMSTFSPKFGPENKNWTDNCVINLKVTVRKSEKKILYAEAEGDFVDFLFSFLTTPLGCIRKLLNDNCSVGCMDNLYKSVKDLNSSWFARPSCNILLDPRVAYQFGCRRQLLKLSEEDTPNYWYGLAAIGCDVYGLTCEVVISKNKILIMLDREAMKVFDPRSPNGRGKCAEPEGFVRRQSLFVVLDNLQVTPLANTSGVTFLQKLNVPLDDLEEHVVSIGETEALNLLGASLTSKTALTDGLFYLVIKPKEEPKA